MSNFRKFLTMVCAASLIVLFNACGDDDNNGNITITESTETTVEFDNSNFGLYKGIIVGSSGVVKIEIFNGDDEAKASIIIDDKTDELTCTSTITKGQAIENATFTGTFSSLTFSVDADGKNPVIANISIEDHSNVVASVSKETSSNVSFCYEGITTGGQDHAGVFNCVRNNNTFSVITKAEDGFTFSSKGNLNKDGSFKGSGKTTFGNLEVTVNYSGRFVGDKMSGTWSNSWEGGSNSGSFSGEKTL